MMAFDKNLAPCTRTVPGDLGLYQVSPGTVPSVTWDTPWETPFVTRKIIKYYRAAIKFATCYFERHVCRDYLRNLSENAVV